MIGLVMWSSHFLTNEQNFIYFRSWTRTRTQLVVIAQQMDSFPQEILENIFNFLNDKNKLSARLVSSLWFKLVKISTFKFVDVGANIFPWLVTRLSKYNYPLNIDIDIIPRTISTKQFIDELSKLTQLRSVRLHNPSKFSFILMQDVKEDYWLKLSTLSNIESWDISEPWPSELLNIFPRLKKIHIPNLTQFHQSNLQLEELSIDVGESIDLIRQLPSSLNSLTLIFKANAEDHDLNHLTNLTHLRIVNRNMDIGGIDTSNITSLQSLELSLVNMPQIHKNTNLTQLRYQLNAYDFQNVVDMTEEIKILTRIERLTIGDLISYNINNSSSNPFSVHSRLTHLSLLIKEYLPPLTDSLRSLNLNITGTFDNRDTLTRLTNLEELTLYLLHQGSNIKYSEYGTIFSNCSKLKRLSAHFLNWDLKESVELESISKLTDLEILILEKASPCPSDYVYLTNLQDLQITQADLTEESWNNLSALKKLTYFYFDSLNCANITPKSIDYNVISQLPLRTLVSHPATEIEELNLISSVSKMTNLRHLNILQLDEEHEVPMLTHLQRLRCLEVVNNASCNLDPLTQLQNLPRK